MNETRLSDPKTVHSRRKEKSGEVFPSLRYGASNHYNAAKYFKKKIQISSNSTQREADDLSARFINVKKHRRLEKRSKTNKRAGKHQTNQRPTIQNVNPLGYKSKSKQAKQKTQPKQRKPRKKTDRKDKS